MATAATAEADDGSGPLKILVVGPQKVGKTTIVNYLAEKTETLGGNNADKYSPTKALRVVEFEREVSSDGPWGQSTSTQVQLWDVSGDQAYEACYPAIQKGTHGVVLVYNPDNRGHEKEIEIWYEWFASNAGLDDEQVLVLAHRNSPGAKPRAPKAMRGVHIEATSFESPNVIRASFDKFLGSVVEARSNPRD